MELDLVNYLTKISSHLPGESDSCVVSNHRPGGSPTAPQRCLRDGCIVEGELFKLLGELSDNPFTEHISHFECLEMNLIISINGRHIVAVQVGDCFLEG